MPPNGRHRLIPSARSFEQSASLKRWKFVDLKDGKRANTLILAISFHKRFIRKFMDSGTHNSFHSAPVRTVE